MRYRDRCARKRAMFNGLMQYFEGLFKVGILLHDIRGRKVDGLGGVLDFRFITNFNLVVKTGYSSPLAAREHLHFGLLSGLTVLCKFRVSVQQ